MICDSIDPIKTMSWLIQFEGCPIHQQHSLFHGNAPRRDGAVAPAKTQQCFRLALASHQPKDAAGIVQHWIGEGQAGEATIGTGEGDLQFHLIKGRISRNK